MRQINLLPETLQKAQAQSRITKSLLITLGPAVLAMALIHVFFVFVLSYLEKQAKSPVVNVDSGGFEQLRDQIQQQKVGLEKYYGQYRAIIDPYTSNYFTRQILEKSGEMTHHKVWLTRINIDNMKRSCELEGKSYNTRLVSEFMLNIKRTSYFENVNLISIDKARDEKVNFKIVCVFK